MNIKFRVELSQSERDQLAALLRGGGTPRLIKRAQILVASDEGFSDEVIAATLNVSGSTIYRTKRRFVEANLEAALSEEPRPGVGRKLSSKEEALLVATACSKPPPGRARWTLELLADEMVQLTDHDELSSETVRRRLAENHLKPWRKDMWCIPKVDGEYVARMEDVLDLYAEAPDPQRPVVCFDESPTQLIGEVREPIAAKPRQLERFDCEYRRNGTINLFVFMDAHRPWRRVKVTDRRTNQDFAECMRELVDVDYPGAPIIRVVMDNLSTHSAGALYDAFPAPMVDEIVARYGRAPQNLLVDTHYAPAAGNAALAAHQAGPVKVFAPPPTEREDVKPETLKRRAKQRAREPESVKAWRRRMATPEGQAVFSLRKAIERINGNLKNHGFGFMPVRGLIKVKAIALWHALAHNFVTIQRLRIKAGCAA